MWTEHTRSNRDAVEEATTWCSKRGHVRCKQTSCIYYIHIRRRTKEINTLNKKETNLLIVTCSFGFGELPKCFIPGKLAQIILTSSPLRSWDCGKSKKTEASLSGPSLSITTDLAVSSSEGPLSSISREAWLFLPASSGPLSLSISPSLSRSLSFSSRRWIDRLVSLAFSSYKSRRRLVLSSNRGTRQMVKVSSATSSLLMADKLSHQHRLKLASSSSSSIIGGLNVLALFSWCCFPLSVTFWVCLRFRVGRGCFDIDRLFGHALFHILLSPPWRYG